MRPKPLQNESQSIKKTHEGRKGEMENAHCHPAQLLIAGTTQNIWGEQSFSFLFHRQVCGVHVHRAVSPSTLASMHITY